MVIFTKKEKVPEIPLAPSLPDLPSEKKIGLPELPSFPNNLKNNNLNQEILKSAISDNLSPEEEEVEYGEIEIPKDFGKREEKSLPTPFKEISTPLIPGKESIMNENLEIIKSPSQTKPKLDSPQRSAPPQIKTRSIPRVKTLGDEAEPIFIRIDKFQLAKKNIEQIRQKVEDIEEIISKVKQVKAKEEEEIKNWSEEIENLKLRLTEIDSDVFSQI